MLSTQKLKCFEFENNSRSIYPDSVELKAHWTVTQQVFERRTNSVIFSLVHYSGIRLLPAEDNFEINCATRQTT